MRRFIALTVVFFTSIGFAQIASAGPERMEAKEMAPAPPPCDWSGFYIGVNAGVAGLNTTINDLDDWFSPNASTLEDTNVAGGGQLGYNWQNGAFVFGVEADADYLNTEDTQTLEAFSGSSGHLMHKAKVDVQGSVRARAGIAVDRALIYATAGVAVSHGRDKFVAEEENLSAHQDDWQAGFVAGVGTEYMFNCHWSARMEALYFHYPTSTGSFTPVGGDHFRFDFQNEDYVVRFGLNYKFGGGR
jgi:outer membrane immunogenic protein